MQATKILALATTIIQNQIHPTKCLKLKPTGTQYASHFAATARERLSRSARSLQQGMAALMQSSSFEGEPDFTGYGLHAGSSHESDHEEPLLRADGGVQPVEEIVVRSEVVDQDIESGLPVVSGEFHQLPTEEPEQEEEVEVVQEQQQQNENFQQQVERIYQTHQNLHKSCQRQHPVVKNKPLTNTHPLIIIRQTLLNTFKSFCPILNMQTHEVDCCDYVTKKHRATHTAVWRL